MSEVEDVIEIDSPVDKEEVGEPVTVDDSLCVDVGVTDGEPLSVDDSVPVGVSVGVVEAVLEGVSRDDGVIE